MSSPTFVGFVESVNGSNVSVRLRTDMTSTLILVDGVSHRVGQVGSFFKISMGYTQLFAVCTQVGAAATPQANTNDGSARWMTVSLFGESIGRLFERGVSQYPTIGDEVHLVTRGDLELVYSRVNHGGAIDIGTIASTNDLAARLDVGPLVTRHSAIVGSTGSGKSNTVAVVLNAVGGAQFSSARVLVVDPHGEYASVVGDTGYVFKVSPTENTNERALRVPYWALPFDELRAIFFGELPQGRDVIFRDRIAELKREGAKLLAQPPPQESITADSPIPFSLKRLWFELDDNERRTFNKASGVDPCAAITTGNAETLTPSAYPPHSPNNTAPFKNPAAKGIERPLELLRSRLSDARYNFLHDSTTAWSPNLAGKTERDLDSLLSQWIGHDRAITVLDVSAIPSETLGVVVGTLTRLIWDCVYWASELPVGGRQQPLLLVLEEAHLFLKDGEAGPAHRSVARIAKEGRKYGVGLQIVTQRPSEVDSSVLSQCGTIIAMRLTNSADREKVRSLIPDDMGNLAALLPALRTGEALVMGEAVPVPSRMRFRQATARPKSDDPQMPSGWQKQRPAASDYTVALKNWRHLKNG